jgi:anti-sigma factor RsiW
VEEIERLLAGELAEETAAAARAHLGVCPACATRCQAAQRADSEVGVLLRQLDVAPPRVSAQTIMSATPVRRFPARGLRAASIMLLIAAAAAAAYALPGSPLRKWIAGRSVVETPPPMPEPDPVAGIAVEPGANLLIVFSRTQQAGDVRVSLVDSSNVVVQARGGAASFSSADERLAIDNHDPASFEIQIPRAAPRIEIRIGDRRVFLKEGARISAQATGLKDNYRLLLR